MLSFFVYKDFEWYRNRLGATSIVIYHSILFAHLWSSYWTFFYPTFSYIGWPKSEPLHFQISDEIIYRSLSFIEFFKDIGLINPQKRLFVIPVVPITSWYIYAIFKIFETLYRRNMNDYMWVAVLFCWIHISDKFSSSGNKESSTIDLHFSPSSSWKKKVHFQQLPVSLAIYSSLKMESRRKMAIK